MTATDIPTALHLGADELPFVEIGDGNKLKVVMVRSAQNLWIVENVFQAGYVVQTHRHTGEVFAYTRSGAWKYREYPEVNRAGSFLYEPANSVHTLEVLEDDTQVWFQMYGANLNLDANGDVESVFDAQGTLEAYLMLAEAEGFPPPRVLVD
jgi:quercetin dioxygenase-like cupin family protein